MEDSFYISKANELIKSGSYTRAGLAKALNISRHRLDKIAPKVENMPRLLTRSQAASHGVKIGRIKWGSHFKLPGSPTTK